jgi:hypothetical protein
MGAASHYSREGRMTLEAEKTWLDLPAGEYAIVELFGHTTLLGRFSEVERFGTRMLALEPLFNGKLLDPVFHGGAAIYRLSPCSPQVAWERQHTDLWQFPPAIRAVIPPELLPAPQEPPPAPTSDMADYDEDNVVALDRG